MQGRVGERRGGGGGGGGGGGDKKPVPLRGSLAVLPRSCAEPLTS